MANETSVYLRDLICAHFNLSELIDLCFDLSINHENLQGQTLSDKSRVLVLYCNRRNSLNMLVARCRRLRPNVAWPAEGLAASFYGIPNESPPISQTENVLILNWGKLDVDLQDIFSVAYNKAEGEGRRIIKTQDVFSAMMRLQPEPLPELIRHLPSDSLPKPIGIEIPTERFLFNGNPDFSACVYDSLTQLSPKIPMNDQLSSMDIFVDIAKFGTGGSVRKLRTHGVVPTTIDEIVSQLGWQVIGR